MHQRPRTARAQDEAMALTLEDCIALCGLTEQELRAIAEHEHIPEIAAAEMGSYLCQSPEGERLLKSMIRDDLEAARARGDAERELALRLVLREFVLNHPRCEERHRRELRLPERRGAG
jgi:hypothetical protein